MTAKTHVLYGSAGTGKSTALIARMRRCIDLGVKPSRICFVAFTKNAAQELTHRVGDMGIQISTVHAQAFRLAGATREQVVDHHKLKEFANLIGIPIAGTNPDDNDGAEEGDEYLALLSLAVARMEPLKDIYNKSPREGSWSKLKYFADGYDQWKRVNGYIDFNDMLQMASQAEPPDFDVMFIDEAQDLSNLQWQLINHWYESIPEIHIAGDDDQAIFVWGGANAHGMDDFATRTGAEVEILGQSYRIPASVHRVAHNVLANISRRVAKVYLPRDEEGTVRRYGDISRVQFKHGEDVMVLFRNHSLRKDFEESLIHRCIPYVVLSGKAGALQSWAAQAVKSWQTAKVDLDKMGNLMLKPNDHSRIKSMLKPSKKAEFDRSPEEFIAKNEWRSVMTMRYDLYSYLVAIEDKYGLGVKPTIQLNTIHGSKGREADRVVLINGMGGKTMDSMIHDPDSEWRTFYVGVTRARHVLDIVESTNPVRIGRC